MLASYSSTLVVAAGVASAAFLPARRWEDDDLTTSGPEAVPEASTTSEGIESTYALISRSQDGAEDRIDRPETVFVPTTVFNSAMVTVTLPASTETVPPGTKQPSPTALSESELSALMDELDKLPAVPRSGRGARPGEAFYCKRSWPSESGRSEPPPNWTVYIGGP